MRISLFHHEIDESQVGDFVSVACCFSALALFPSFRLFHFFLFFTLSHLSAMSDPLRREMSILSRTHMNSRCADCRAKGEREAADPLGGRAVRGCSGAHCSASSHHQQLIRAAHFVAAHHSHSHHSSETLSFPSRTEGLPSFLYQSTVSPNGHQIDKN